MGHCRYVVTQKSSGKLLLQSLYLFLLCGLPEVLSLSESEVCPDLSGDALLGPELKVPLPAALVLCSDRQFMPRQVDVHCSTLCMRCSLPPKVPVSPWLPLLVLCNYIEEILDLFVTFIPFGARQKSWKSCTWTSTAWSVIWMRSPYLLHPNALMS